MLPALPLVFFIVPLLIVLLLAILLAILYLTVFLAALSLSLASSLSSFLSPAFYLAAFFGNQILHAQSFTHICSFTLTALLDSTSGARPCWGGSGWMDGWTDGQMDE